MAGLVIRRPDTGATLISLATRITRFMGSFEISGAGRWAIPPSEGVFWFYARHPGYYTDRGYGTKLILDGQSLYWENMPPNTIILWGYY